MTALNNTIKREYRTGTTSRVCVYCIQNTVTGQRYIGSTINLTKRWSEHRQALRANRHTNRYLQRAWNKYGAAAFAFTVLADCAAEDLITTENQCILEHQSNHRRFGYNTRLDAASSAGVRLSAETRLKMSHAHLGKKQSVDHARKQCLARRGQSRTSEQTSRMALARKRYTEDQVNLVLRAINTEPKTWGWQQRIAERTGVHRGYVSRLVNKPPQWIELGANVTA